MTDEKQKFAAHVYVAITAVMAAMAKAGISKGRSNAQQGYKFRGIDDVYNALSAVLAEHKLCMLPRVVAREHIERATKSGGLLNYTILEVEFDLVSSIDGSKHTIRTMGEAMDSADKATNKAMSAAMKYACLMAFQIPTEGDNDADAHTHEVVAKRAITPAAGVWEAMSEEEQTFLQGIADQATAMNPAAAIAFINSENLDADEKVALWTRFDAKFRSAMKAATQKAAA